MEIDNTYSGCIFFTRRDRWTLRPYWVWERRWATKLPLDRKSLGHKSQRNGRSALLLSLWLRWWNRRLPFDGNVLPHSPHTYGRSPVWQQLEFHKNHLVRVAFVWLQWIDFRWSLTSCGWLNIPSSWMVYCKWCKRTDCHQRDVSNGW